MYIIRIRTTLLFPQPHPKYTADPSSIRSVKSYTIPEIYLSLKGSAVVIVLLVHTCATLSDSHAWLNATRECKNKTRKTRKYTVCQTNVAPSQARSVFYGAPLCYGMGDLVNGAGQTGRVSVDISTRGDVFLGGVEEDGR